MARFLDLIVAAVATLCLVACSGARTGESATSEAPSVEYFYGTMSTSSPDGRVPYGTPVITLVRREITPRAGRIVESVLQDGITTVTVLSRESSGHFAARSEDGRGMGSITVEGNEWRWRRWTYALAAPKGDGRIEGTGHYDGEWIETEKYVVTSSGERRARISDRLMAITDAEYAKRRAQMLTSTTSKRR